MEGKSRQIHELRFKKDLLYDKHSSLIFNGAY